MGSRSKLRQTKNRKKLFFWIGGILLVLALLIGYYFYQKIDDTFSSMHNPLARDENDERQEIIQTIFEEEESLNILLLGEDEQKGKKGRTDVIILLSLNPRTDSTMMLSIPRDTRVHTPDFGPDKINHAYALRDINVAVETVEEILDLPVHFYAKVNMDGFKEGVDALGGVSIVNDFAFEHGGHYFSEGEIHLNGDEALSFVRMRKQDPQGDFGRNKRQRSVIEAVMHKAASFSNITKVGSFLNIIGDHVETNVSMDRTQSLFSSYRNTRKDIKSIELKGDGQMIDSIWYYIVSDDEFQRVHQEIIDHMKLTE